MNFQHLFAMTAMGIDAESMYYIAIGILACVLGAELAGIFILVRKMKAASREAYLRENAERYHSHHAAGFLLGAVPAAAQISLLVLSIAAAASALVFVILLIVFRAKGYSLISPAALRTSETSEASDIKEEPVSTETESLSVFDDIPVQEPTVQDFADEEQHQDAYTEAFDLMEDPAEAEEPVAEEIVSADEDASSETVSSDKVSEPVTVLQRPTGVYTHTIPGVPGGVPIYSSAYPAGQPIIEKHITETVREIIKETNTTTTTEGGNAHATEEILKAIAELMKLGTQLRMEKELAVENPVIQNSDSVTVLSGAVEDELDIDDAEDDEDLEADESENISDDEEGEEGEGSDDEYENELFTGNERIVGFDEETGCYIVAHYRKSFEAKLIQARHDVKKYYSEIKNALLSYEDTKDRITWNGNTYTNDRTHIAKINVRQRTLDLYLALDPATLEDSAYHGRDVGDKKKYAETPFLFKVNSPRKLTLALELVRRTCEEQGLSPIDIEAVNYEEQYPFEATEDLVRRGLIREYLREEKPAVTFELDPDHSPDLPEEDGSVIPANANFTWEIDEDAEHAPDPEPQPEPEPEPEPVPESEPDQINIDDALADVLSHIQEAQPAAPTTTTTTHETVKTTERHYTEHSYTSGNAVYTETLLTEGKQPVSSIAEPQMEMKIEEPEEVTKSAADEPATTESVAEDPLVADEVIAFEEPAVEVLVESAESEETPEESEEEHEESEEEYEESEEEYEESEEEYEESEEEYEESEEEYEEGYEDDDTAYEEEAEEAEEVEEVEEEEVITVAPPKPVNDSTVALLDVCIFDDYFESGAIVNLETLKQMDLVPASAQTLKVYASGSLKGKFTVEANHFTLDAIKAIGDADGDSIMIR